MSTAEQRTDPPVAAGYTPLPQRAVTVWRISALLGGLPVVGIAAAIALSIDALPETARAGLLIVPALLLLLEVVVVVPVRYRLWGYAVGDEEIDLRAGWPVTTRTAIPVVRIQHVDTHQGPLARAYDLADLRVHTAAGSIRIPSLGREEAERIRRRIAELARIPDDL